MSLKNVSQNLGKWFFLMFMFFGILASAQDQKTISGTVIADELPLVGANVVVKDTKIGTTTDFDGNFSLSVPSSAKIVVVSFLGYATQEVAITKESMQIVLQ